MAAAATDGGFELRLTLFSVDEANQSLAEIRPRVERLARAKRDLDRLQRRVALLELAATGADRGSPDAEELRLALERRDRGAETLRDAIQTVEERGVVVKDLDHGLVDFYSIAGDRLIFLCWRLGEAEVSHWHTLEDGFAGRQPLHREAGGGR